MELSREEQAMLDGELGKPRRWAIEHMMRVGRFFDAPDFVEVTQAHIMADTESLGEAGHYRSAFEDFDEPERKRHLYRLWHRETGSTSYDGRHLE